MAPRRSISLVGVVALLISGAVAVIPAPTSAAPAPADVSTPLAGGFHSVTPFRLLDTRLNLGGFAPSPNGVIHLQVAGRGGVPGSGVAAVALNVTVTGSARPGYVSVFPEGSGAPTTSNVNFRAGQTISNLVVATLGDGGVVDLVNRSPGTAQLVADVSGYYLNGPGTQPGTYNPLVPKRLVDTRIAQGATAIPAHGRAFVQVDGLGGVPASGVGVAALDVAVVQPASNGSLTLYADAANAIRPAASNVNYRSGETLANLVLAPVGATGRVVFYNGGNVPVQVVADVMGYTAGGVVGDSGAFRSLPLGGILDTRTSSGGKAPGGHGTLRVAVAGRAGIPSSSLRAVALSVTVTGQTRAGFVTAYPDGVSRPTSSNVNFDAGATTSNLVVVPVGPDGYVDLYNGSIATVQIVVNAVGVYLGVFGEPAASCTGFTNSTGMTNSEITIANASDLTGPVPGLYAAAQQATQAYAAYFNSSADICGRSLNVDALDTQTSSAGDQQAAAAACTDAFAMVGSLSLFDNGGAGDVAGCGIPDLRARPSTATRRDVATSFGVSYPDLGSAPAAVADYFTQNQSAATQHAAMLYLNVGSYPTQATSEMAAWQSTAFNFVYSAGIDVSAFNYATYVTAMINKGVKYVQFDGPPQNAIRLAQAMKAQAFSPVFVVDSLTGDDPFAASGGADVDGTFRFTDAVLPFDPPTGELALYEHWLQVVAPGATPSVAGIYAWSAAMLFTRQAMALGGNLNRASLVTSLSHVSGWNSDGLTAPEAVAAKTPAACVRVYHLVSGEWVRGPGSWALCS